MKSKLITCRLYFFKLYRSRNFRKGKETQKILNCEIKNGKKAGKWRVVNDK